MWAADQFVVCIVCRGQNYPSVDKPFTIVGMVMDRGFNYL